MSSKSAGWNYLAVVFFDKPIWSHNVIKTCLLSIWDFPEYVKKLPIISIILFWKKEKNIFFWNFIWFAVIISQISISEAFIWCYKSWPLFLLTTCNHPVDVLESLCWFVSITQTPSIDCPGYWNNFYRLKESLTGDHSSWRQS